MPAPLRAAPSGEGRVFEFPPGGPRSAGAHRSYDAVVVGAGIAGLAFVLRLPPDWRVALLTKGALGESNTR